MNPPIVYDVTSPSSHKTSSITNIVQSIDSLPGSLACAAVPPGRLRIAGGCMVDDKQLICHEEREPGDRSHAAVHVEGGLYPNIRSSVTGCCCAGVKAREPCVRNSYRSMATAAPLSLLRITQP